MKPVELGVYYYYGAHVYTVSNLVTSITWSGDVAEASRKCEITLVNTRDGVNQYLLFEVGKTVYCTKNGKTFFRGIIFATRVQQDGTMTLSCRDANHYLTKNTDTLKFINQKASQVVLNICRSYGIPYGNIADTSYVIPRLLLRNMSLYDMIVTALTETKKKTGKVFLLTNDDAGKLNLIEKTKQVERLIIAEGNNLISADYSTSIEEMRNSIRITGKAGEDSSGVVVENGASIHAYGLMRQKEHEGEKTDAELKPIANALLSELNKVTKESNVEAVGDTSIRSGVSVQVSDVMTKIQGGFYVLSDSHTLTPNLQHTMSLTVSHTLDVKELEYREPVDETEKKATASSSSTDGADSSPGVNAKGKKISATARGLVGKLRYVFGGTSIGKGSGDCSGFTQYCYAQNGIAIGRDTISQSSKGVKVSKSDARAGDLVFFQGTYRSGVSHVGIVTSGGKCVSLHNSGCTEHSYTSGYWGNHFMQIRRVTS